MVPTLGALFRHVVVGGLWHPVKRKAETDLIIELQEGRYSSFPFVSPDTFRSLCDVIIENGETLRKPKTNFRNIVFFRLSDIDGTEISFSDRPSLTTLDRVISGTERPPILILSYGDFLPARRILDELVRRCHFVFAVNLIEETEGLEAIPLGLQNMSRNLSGRLGDYLDYHEGKRFGERVHDVLAAFEPENNPYHRDSLVKLLKSSKYGWNPHRLTKEDYRRKVAESLFVLSPPGRGFDCHRTWESIYLGAVPVILKGSLSQNLVESQPILEVPGYEKFLQLSHTDLIELYLRIRKLPPRKGV